MIGSPQLQSEAALTGGLPVLSMISSDPQKLYEQSYDSDHFTDGKKEWLNYLPKVTQLVWLLLLLLRNLNIV